MTPSEHCNINILDNTNGDLLDRFGAGVSHDEAASDLVAVIIKLSVKSGLKLQLTLTEHEILPGKECNQTGNG